MAKTHNASQNQSNAPGDSIILEEEIDPNYEPTQDEVIEYAKVEVPPKSEGKQIMMILVPQVAK